MAAITYARAIRCDWPGCQSQGEVILGENWPDRNLPKYWTDVSQSIAMTSVYGAAIRELCPEHSRVSVAELEAVFRPAKISTEIRP